MIFIFFRPERVDFYQTSLFQDKFAPKGLISA